MDFYTIILIIASVILVVALAGIGYAMTNSNSTAPFPSYVNPCPDFWETNPSSTSNGYTCSAINDNKGIGVGSNYNPQGVCKDYKWATTNHVLWDGVTNNRDVSSCSKTK